ncbi:MAG: hypothetical protein A4S09_04175 [Proteobacteria bacterium SG_bin7]|nr:MAG: hypothetical protein A4S09_04175 [Proteobacteria bacterium SG_bin7]
MSRLFQAVVFLAFSLLDLHVEGRELIQIKDAKTVIMQPKDCVIESSVCSVMTPKRKKYELVFGKSTALMDENTAVLRESATQIALLKGRMWVKTSESIVIRSEFGIAKVTNGEIWVTKIGQKVTFSPLTGELIMVPRGSKESIVVLPNYENWLGPVNKAGVATSGIPRLLDIENHIQRWGKLYTGNKMQFKKDVHEYFLVWYSLVEEDSDKNREIALRTIATEAENKRREEDRQKKIKDERSRVRDMMMRRLGLE